MKTPRILVIDDDDHVRESLVDELSQSYEVEAVASSTEALDILAVDQYDVIISDFKMPDHDGIEVLDFARTHQGDAVRVLLTGYLDDRAHKALMQPDAPFKVGKPWHDELEVVVRRGLEQRELARRLNASVEDALRLSTFDAELAAATSALELVDVLLRRALTVEGLDTCSVVTRVDDHDQVIAGTAVAQLGAGWLIDVTLDVAGELRLRARGSGESARQLVSYMAHRAQRCFGVLEPQAIPIYAPEAGSGRQNQLIRQATIGAMTGSLLHDLASTMQALSGALGEICDLAEQDPRIAVAASEALTAGSAAVDLFVTMRKFIRDGEVQTRPLPLKRLVDGALRITNGYVRERARLIVHAIPDVEVSAAEALMIQVISNLLRNAANASPQGGTIDVEAEVVGDDLVMTVTDDGPGVSPAIADQMFEPFATNTPDGTGLGLAIAAYVIQCHGGRISYRKHPDRGACFQVRLRRVAAAVAQPAA